MMVIVGVSVGDPVCACAKLRRPDREGCGDIVVLRQCACVLPQEAAVELPKTAQ